jgi:hypothetical protein
MLTIFPSLAGMSPTKSPWPGIIKLLPARESLVGDIPAREGKSATLFYSAQISTKSLPTLSVLLTV